MIPHLPISSTLWTIVLTILSQVHANHPSCECYIVSGPEPGYFQNYRFWDFRYVPPEPELAKEYQFSPLGNNAGAAKYNEANGPLLKRPILLRDTKFADEWTVQSWSREGSSLFPVPIVNSERNVFITNDPWHEDATNLVFRTTRLDDYSSTAEIETRLRNILHCSVRVRLRLFAGDGILQPPIWGKSVSNNGEDEDSDVSVEPRLSASPPSGACAGIFTYHSTTSESDIEILTSDPPYRIHYANQPDYDPITDEMIPGASTVVDLPVRWTSWATHRLDWFSSNSRWWVDGIIQERKTYSVPYNPSMLVINLWSDGGNWTGNMSVGDSVYMGIESIEIAYNATTDGADISDELPNRRHPNHILRANMANEFVREEDPEESLLKSDENEGIEIHKGCRVACRIDDVQQKGFPEVVYDYSA
ncbi:CAZyme family GH16 [Paecilomyces variotii]|nr:CAZyme family GH16 [Paecilomyces variotii]